MFKRLLATTAICGLTFFAATPAFAACSSNAPTTGTTVTCTGSDTTGVNGGVNTNITVNVNAGASVLPAVAGNDGVAIATGAVTVAATGSAASTSAVGVHMTNSTNAGTQTVTNSGTITGGTFGILLENGGTVTVNSGATVSGATAIRVANINSTAASIVSISNGATVTGNVIAGANANDEFHWVQDTNGNFATGDIGGAATYRNFEKIYKDGTATTTLTGTNALNWNITAGTLVSNYNQIGNVTGTGGTLQLNNGGSPQNYSGNITGSVAVTASNSVQLTLSGTNSFTGAMTINGGSILVLQNNAAASATSGITVTNSGLAFGTADTYTQNIILSSGLSTLNSVGNNITISGNITGGSGHNANINGGSVYTLTGINSFGNLILANASTIAGAGTALGDNASSFSGTSGTIRVLNGGTVASSIGGSLAVTLDNATSVFSGTNGFTGALTLSNGAGLTVGSAANFSGTSGVALSGASNFGFGAAMTTDRNFSVGAGGAGLFTNGNDVTMSGVISGNGALSKNSTGNLILTNTNTYNGALTVSAGRLSVNGSLGSTTSTTVANTATLGGTGTVSNVSVSSGGTFAPGNSIGTIAVTGTLAINNGAHYAVEYSNAAADRANATGAITIGASSILDLTGTGVTADYGPTTAYTILQGATLTGTFGTVNENLAFLDPTLTYNATSVVLTLNRNGAEFSSVAKDDEQEQVAQAVTDLGAGNAVFNAFVNLTTAQAQDALDDLSGEHNAGVGAAMAQSTGVMQSVLTAHMTGLSHGGSIGNTAALALPADPSTYTAAYLEPAAGTNASKFWMQAIGTLGRSDADNGKGTPKQDRHSYGAIGGLDMPYEDGFVGIFAGYERGEVTTNSEGAASDLNNYHLGAYGTHSIWQGMNISAGLGATYHDIESVRHVAVGGTTFSPHGDTHAWTAHTFAELSKPFDTQYAAVEPFGGISLTYNHMQGYDETGGGAANLSVESANTFNPATIIGARFGKKVENVNLTGSIGWQHTFGDIDGKITERFVGGTTSFDAFGAARSRDAAVIGLGLNTDVTSGVSAYAGYDGTLSSDSQDHGFKAGIKMSF